MQWAKSLWSAKQNRLWMPQKNQGQDYLAMKLLLENESNVKSYVDNALIPILNLLGDHPAVLTWEIFNEPEGMTSNFGWSSGGRVTFFEIQRFVNRFSFKKNRRNCILWSSLRHTRICTRRNNYNPRERQYNNKRYFTFNVHAFFTDYKHTNSCKL